MDKTQFKTIFIQETYERLSAIERNLLLLEAGKGDARAIDGLFRSYHSIKGMCASMGYEKMKGFAHMQESILEAFRNSDRRPTPGTISVLFESLDMTKRMLQMVEDGIPHDDLDLDLLVRKIDELSLGWDADEGMAAGHDREREQVQARLSRSIKVEKRVFDELLRLNGELVTVLSGIRAIAMRSRSMELTDRTHRLEKTVEELNSYLLSARMLEFDTLAQNLPRVIRDISMKGAKEIDMAIEGGETSLDMSVLEGITSPLIHVIRNAVDHGIEPPDERERAGKPRRGVITVRASDKRDDVCIEITDDGRGIDLEKVKEKAIKAGLERRQLDAMSRKEALKLICLPGLTLATEVTDVSGRGVGMDAVMNSVRAVGGTLDIESTPGKGTSVMMTLPRLASIIKILLLKVGGELVSVPVAKIEKVLDSRDGGLAGREIKYDERDIPVKRVGRVLGIPPLPGNGNGRGHKLVVARGKDGFFAMAVDEACEEIDAYIRPLAEPFSQINGVSGYTITDDGRPVFMLDTAQIGAMADND